MTFRGQFRCFCLLIMLLFPLFFESLGISNWMLDIMNLRVLGAANFCSFTNNSYFFSGIWLSYLETDAFRSWFQVSLRRNGAVLSPGFIIILHLSSKEVRPFLGYGNQYLQNYEVFHQLLEISTIQHQMWHLGTDPCNSFCCFTLLPGWFSRVHALISIQLNLWGGPPRVLFL